MAMAEQTSLPPMSMAEFVASPEFATLTPQQKQQLPQRYVDVFGKSLARTAAQQYGLDPDIFTRLIQQESGWKADALSKKGAQGLGQFMPGTAAEQGVNTADPDQSILGSA